MFSQFFETSSFFQRFGFLSQSTNKDVGPQKTKQNKRWHNQLAIVLIFASIISGIATYAALTETPPFGDDPKTVIWLLNVDLILLLALVMLVLLLWLMPLLMLLFIDLLRCSCSCSGKWSRSWNWNCVAVATLVAAVVVVVVVVAVVVVVEEEDSCNGKNRSQCCISSGGLA